MKARTCSRHPKRAPDPVAGGPQLGPRRLVGDPPVPRWLTAGSAPAVMLGDRPVTGWRQPPPVCFMPGMDVESQKRAAAERALDYVRPGMRLGIGTGSTARHFVDLLGARVSAGLRIVGVATSEETRRQAEGLGIPLATLDETTEL